VALALCIVIAFAVRRILRGQHREHRKPA